MDIQKQREAVKIIQDLVHNTECTSHDNHINYRNDTHSLSIFQDEDIFNMEVMEDSEICRGSIGTTKFYILDEI